MKLSIIVPVYRESKDLDKFFKIIKAQTSKNYEVILIIDTNKNHILDVVEEHKKNIEKKMQVIYNSSRIGRSAAVQTGINKAKGAYSIIMSTGDIIRKTFVEESLEVIDNSKADIIEFKATFKEPIKFNGRIRLKIPKLVDIHDNLEVVAYAYAFDFNKLFKSSILKKTTKYNESISINSRFSISNTYRAFAVAKTYSNVSKSLVISKSKVSINFNPLKIIKQWQYLMDTITISSAYRIFSQEIEYAAFFNIAIFLFGIVGASKNSVLLKKLEKSFKSLNQKEFSAFLESNQYMARKNSESSFLHIEPRTSFLIKLHKEFK
ncbi:glycosyltransferase family 2 protein [Candidatus Mycoplasma mahonii]|uniref:glycosyltransferase family 2 protein n=1 Tax=Candidatus Mycoplasma mahonii TaxID=3004105 RepID=UPI0026ED72BB|nr:glycosyltransferase family 2 protein [Candidatus Mycoplasma mahonii]WKX02481.1 glycosyltransferase family 2 protein [Candidatus Mycoplasma mahonii]